MKQIVSYIRIFSKYQTILWYFNRFKKSKKKYYSDKLIKFKGDSNKTWAVMNKLIGKSCINKSCTTKTSCRQHKNIARIEYCKKIILSVILDLDYQVRFVNQQKHFKVTLAIILKLQVNQFLWTTWEMTQEINKTAGYKDISYDFAKKCFGEI